MMPCRGHCEVGSRITGRTWPATSEPSPPLNAPSTKKMCLMLFSSLGYSRLECIYPLGVWFPSFTWTSRLCYSAVLFRWMSVWALPLFVSACHYRCFSIIFNYLSHNSSRPLAIGLGLASDPFLSFPPCAVLCAISTPTDIDILDVFHNKGRRRTC